MDTGDLLKRLRTIVLAALLTLAVGSVVQGRVFVRWKGRNDVVGNLKRLGGTVAYESEIRLNGGAGTLTVVGFDDALDAVIPSIHQAFALPGDAPPSDSTLHILAGETTTLRLILLRFADPGRTIAIAIEQSNVDFNASRDAPHRHLLKALPPYPGSTPTFYAEDVNTRLSVAVSTASAPAERVRAFFDRELRMQGWIPSLSDSQHPIPEMPLYHRGSELCCMLVTPAETDSTQRITLLHKTLGNISK